MSKVKNVKKQVIEDSEEDSSSQLVLTTTKKQQVNAKKQTKKKPQVQESSEEDQTPVVKPKATQPVKAKSPVQKAVVAPKKKAQKQSSEQQSEEQQPKNVKKVVPPVKATKPVAKKQESSEEESEEEVKPVAKKPVAKSPAQKAQQPPKKKPIAEESQSSEQQQVKPTKKGAKSPIVKATTAKTAKKVEKQSSSQQQSQEQVKPVKKVPKSPLQKAKSPAQKAVVPKKKQQSEEQSEQQSEEQVKPKVTKVKKVVKMVPESEEEEEQKPVTKAVQPVRKASKQEPLKVVGKKAQQAVNNDDEEQGQFEACVQGLSYNAYDSDIRELFEPCGTILNINLLMRPDGKSKGMAFVRFSKKSALQKALDLNGTQHFDRTLKIQEARGKPTEKGQSMPGRGGQRQQRPIENTAQITTPTLFIGGLSYKSTAESIKEHFNASGAVQSARVVTDRQTQKPRGFGYIEFYDVETAKKAYQQLNGSYLDGRQIRLDSAAQRQRPANGGYGGGFGGGSRGGFGGGSRGGFGGDRGNTRNPGNATVLLSEDDKNAKKGAMGTFQGKKISF